MPTPRATGSKKIRARFPQEFKRDLPGALKMKRAGRKIKISANGNSEALLAELKPRPPEDLKIKSLSLEEFFAVSDTLKKGNS